MRKIRKLLTWLLVGLAAAVVAVLAALPFAAPPVIRRVAEGKLAEMGYPSRVDAKLAYGWRGGPVIDGTLSVAVKGSPWRADAEFGAGFGSWHAVVTVPRTEFSESDPVVARLLAEHPVEAVSNLTFNGEIEARASVERTGDMPVPVWRVDAPVRISRAEMMHEDRSLAIVGLRARPGASGISGHVDVAPVFAHAQSVSVDGLVLSNAFASVRATEKALLATEAGAAFCGGRISLYSLFLDPGNLNAGFTLYMEDADAGELMKHINAFNGSATGRLDGKLRLFVREGGTTLHVGEAYLATRPGERGKIRMERPEAITDHLALAGVDARTRDNVANALADLDYSALMLSLSKSGRDLNTLSIMVEGTATRGKTTVPVNLNVNINGAIEQLLNTGLGYSRILKGEGK